MISFFGKRPVLYVQIKGTLLSLVEWDEKKLRFETVFLRETPEEVAKSKVRDFLEDKSYQEILFILGRSEVLQKELALERSASISIKESLEFKIREVLPFQPDEMAYGISLTPERSRYQGLLYAIPERHLHQNLFFLQGLGIRPTEIITEDQPLCWLLQRAEKKGPLLLLYQDEESFIFLLSENERLQLSRVYPRKSQDVQGLDEMLKEISLTLLQANVSPGKVFLAGVWSANHSEEVLDHFHLPLEKIQIPQVFRPPGPVFYGATFFCEHAVISLLPKEEKIQRWWKGRYKKIRHVFVLWGFFFSAVTLAFCFQLLHRDASLQKITGELRQKETEAQKIQAIKDSLEKAREAQSSKDRVLRFLKAMATRMPVGIRFKNLEIERQGFRFEGEAATHASISETVQVLNDLAEIKDAKLERTNLRKRLNEDYFEFEVSGLWKPGN